MQVKKATVRIGYGKTDLFKIGKGVCQGCMLLLSSFNLYAEYIMQNAGLDESSWNQDCWEKYQQPQITSAESEEELKNLLMKEESEKAGL